MGNNSSSNITNTRRTGIRIGHSLPREPCTVKRVEMVALKFSMMS